MTQPRREGIERQYDEASAHRLHVVGTATGSTLDAFRRQSGIDVQAEEMQSAYTQPVPAYEASPNQGPQVIESPVQPAIGEVATFGYEAPADVQGAADTGAPLGDVRRIEDFPEIERPFAA